MPINWNLLDTQFGQKLGNVFDPAAIQEKQNRLSDLATQRDMQGMQIMQNVGTMNDQQRARNDEQQSRDIYKKFSNDPAAMIQSFRSAGLHAQADAYAKQQMDLQKSGLEFAAKRVEAVHNISAQIAADPTNWQSIVKDAQTNGGLHPQDAAHLTQTMGRMTPEQIVPYATRNAMDAKELSGKLWDKQNPKVADINHPFIYDASGKMVDNPAYQNYEKSKAKAGAQSIDVKVETKGRTKLSENDANDISEMGKEAKQSMNALPALERMARNESGAFSGLFAPGMLGLAATADALGFATPELRKTLTSTQLFDQGSEAYATSMLKALMGSQNLSDADFAAVKKVAPRLATTPEARQELIDYARQAVKGKIDLYNAARDFYDKHDASLTGFQYQTNFQAENTKQDYGTPPPGAVRRMK